MLLCRRVLLLSTLSHVHANFVFSCIYVRTLKLSSIVKVELLAIQEYEPKHLRSQIKKSAIETVLLHFLFVSRLWLSLYFPPHWFPSRRCHRSHKGLIRRALSLCKSFPANSYAKTMHWRPTSFFSNGFWLFLRSASIPSSESRNLPFSSSLDSFLSFLY